MAYTGLPTGTTNGLNEKIRDLIDAGGAAGTLRIYKGAIPGPNGTPAGGDLLAELPLAYPCAQSSVAGALTFDPITADPDAAATGTATWARIVTSAGASVIDLDVKGTGGGGSLELNTVTINIGDPVAVTSLILYTNPTYNQ
jgi:hypothetical protein